MAEEELEGAGNEGRVVVHDEVEEDAEEHATTLSIKVEFGRLVTTTNIVRRLIHSLIPAQRHSN